MAEMSTSAKLQKSPAIVRITETDVEEFSKKLNLKMTKDEISSTNEYLQGACDAYQRIYELQDTPPTVKYPRTPGHRETSDDSWYWRCNIKGADKGLLSGKTVAVKDNVCVAGVPMMNGSKLLEGYVPDRDATIVTRMLDAGCTILGKSVCEDLCFSGNSCTSATGPVRNPFDSTRSAGGSSSGSGSLVARGIVDMAIGGDQGGSIRIPACWCGIVGLKPSYGLVPYTGIMPIELTLDHTGPMARTVTDCAAFLEAIAGYDDGNDPRQHPATTVPKFTELLEDGITGTKIAILKEGFEGVESDYAEVVRKAAVSLEKVGATVTEVSLPIHNDGAAIWTPVAYEGTYSMMLDGNGHGYCWKGKYDLNLQEALSRGYNLRPYDHNIAVKQLMVFSEYIKKNYQNKFYAKAQNLTQKLTQEYNKLLKTVDVVIMPTLTAKPFKLPTEKHTGIETFKLMFGMLKNTAPFDSTGHPALSINAGFSEGLPCGMMIVGRLYDDMTVLKVARAFEKIRDTK